MTFLGMLSSEPPKSSQSCFYTTKKWSLVELLVASAKLYGGIEEQQRA